MLSLAIFLLGFWSLAFYADQMFREDLEKSAGEQQLSTASFIAESLDQELTERFDALRTVAVTLDPTTATRARKIQRTLEERPVFQAMFNGGTFVVGMDGVAIASLPHGIPRVGVSYLDRDCIIAALREGRSTVGKPVIGKMMHAPIVMTVVPIVVRGQVVGALAGVIDLGKPNFLNSISQGTYGERGGYLLIAAQHRVIVTASDQRRIMESLPLAGLDPLVDRFNAGYRGSGIMVNQRGEKVLVSSAHIPVAGWRVSVSLPVAEAFAPADSVWRRLIFTTVALSLLVASLTWWMVRRQLEPMTVAASALEAMAEDELPAHPLSVVVQDETGTLLSGFNSLLGVLREREAALRRSEERVTLMLRGAGGGAWDWDLQRGELFYAERWWTMLGYVDGEFEATPDLWRQLMHPDDLERVSNFFAAALADDSLSYEVEFRLRCKDGSYLLIASYGFIQRDSDGKAIRVAGTNRDITERKRAEAELLAARTAADDANTAKSRFLAAASHDLRQPLSAISMYVGVLKATMPPESVSILKNMEDCIGGLSELLTDLLDISKLDAGVVTPTLVNFSIDVLMSELTSVHSTSATLKGLQLRWRDAGAVTYTDRVILRRIVGNLLSNAIRYTHAGGVLIGCRRRQGRRWLEVWDTGIGIAADQTDVIFEEFRQLGDDARSRGSGLGLAIAAKSAALLGLQIRLRSRPGRGSMFAIELPPAQDVTQDTTVVAQPLIKSLRVAVVDDNLHVLQALVLALQQAGHEVVAAVNGKSLIETLGHGVPDIVIADYRLAAGENGFDVISMARDVWGMHLPAMLITGDTDPALIRSMSGFGIAVHYKPVNFEFLQIYIKEAMAQSPC